MESLQQRFVRGLEQLSSPQAHPAAFAAVEWLRDEGRHGGGVRYELGDTPIFDRASVNVSQVHYDDLPDKKLGSATALSTIIHPRHPTAPSVHIHVSWTEMRDGRGYWRAMADLNPCIVHEEDRRSFAQAVRAAAPNEHVGGEAQGDRYFRIPALDRCRGVYHFYLEGLATGDEAADEALALGVGRAAIDVYLGILGRALARAEEPTAEQRAAQLAYHTLYLFQVLTLDRGTTSGLLVHAQNDVGILGSLPSHVDRERLASFAAKVPAPQEKLVNALVDVLPAVGHAIEERTKRALAEVVRTHYLEHPEALALQASGDIVPPTVANHR